MKHIICFIDDSEFEHDLVRNEIAPLARKMTFVQTYTFEEAREALGSNKPALFLLDLWGQDEDVQKPYLTPKEEIGKKIAAFPTVDTVYNGLEEFRGDVNNEYLKRFFSIVDCWRTLFEEVCSRIGQNGKYGLSNLRQVREHYPGTPAVFYTRKSLIYDAVKMFKAGAEGLFIKPTGTTDAETRRLTREYAPELAEDLMQIIEMKTPIKEVPQR
jgi:DNA-binding NarL/FixJ family response regulator